MIADCVVTQLQDPYHFPSMHRAVREPYDYHELGQLYTEQLIDFLGSVLGHQDRWARIARLLEAGENVVLLSNHATEADPGVFSALLQEAHPALARDIVYVAGDRVYGDPLWIPFSLGRNLFCVHSKRHLDDEPETKSAKQQDNRRTLVAMQVGGSHHGKGL
jgi:glycerol-3-phosphate O-acyltransferase